MSSTQPTAQERREARRKKILENAGSRINQILGVEGERRKEPGLEDGAGSLAAPTGLSPGGRVTRSQAAKMSSPIGQSPQSANQSRPSPPGAIESQSREIEDSKQVDASVSGKSGPIRRKQPAQHPETKEESDLRENGTPTQKKSAKKMPEIASPKMEEAFFKGGKRARKWFERRRIWFAALCGVLMRLWVIMNIFPYVALPWIAYMVLIEVYEAKTAKKYLRYPLHGHLMDVLVCFGINERVSYVAGRMAEVVSRILDDSVVMFLCFLVTHCLCGQMGY